VASLFWVGGAGTYDGTTNHFATSSGGSATVALPTSSDSVTFDSNSGSGTVTIGANLTCATMTINAANITVQCDGTHGITVSSDAAGALTLTAGTLDTNGSPQTWSDFNASGTTTRSLLLGASVITMTGKVGGVTTWNMGTTTNLTFTVGTSTILFTCVGSGVPIMNSGGKSFYNVQLIPAVGGVGNGLGLTADLTVTGTLTVTADSIKNRVMVCGLNTTNLSAFGTTRTITAAAVSLTNVDFIDITGAGAAAPFTGTSIGDGQGNSGITFTPAVTRYAVVAGNWSNTATWSTTDGGSGGASVPICHDTVFFTANSGAGTYSIDVQRTCANIDCTGFTRTLSSGATLQWSGNFKAGTGMTLTLTGSNTFMGRGARTITMNGKTFGGVVQFNAPNGTYTLQDNFTTTGASARIINGTLELNGKTLTCPTFLASVGPVATTPVVSMSGGTITLNGTGTVWNITVTMTVTGGGTVDITDTSATAKTVAFGNSQTHATTFRHAATGGAGLTFTGTPVTVTGLDLECTTARTVTLAASATLTITGTLTLEGASGATLSLVSSSPGTATTLDASNGVAYASNAFISLSADVTLKAPRAAGGGAFGGRSAFTRRKHLTPGG
jgi:fibronectin-binding autotransporter adhesin